MTVDCDTCVWATRSGGCVAWACNYLGKTEVEKVVHCGDCLWWVEEGGWNGKTFCDKSGMQCDERDYCSRGGRRKGDEED